MTVLDFVLKIENPETEIVLRNVSTCEGIFDGTSAEFICRTARQLISRPDADQLEVVNIGALSKKRFYIGVKRIEEQK